MDTRFSRRELVCLRAVSQAQGVIFLYIKLRPSPLTRIAVCSAGTDPRVLDLLPQLASAVALQILVRPSQNGARPFIDKIPL
jgi:hypothetical protein